MAAVSMTASLKGLIASNFRSLSAESQDLVFFQADSVDKCRILFQTIIGAHAPFYDRLQHLPYFYSLQDYEETVLKASKEGFIKRWIDYISESSEALIVWGRVHGFMDLPFIAVCDEASWPAAEEIHYIYAHHSHLPRIRKTKALSYLVRKARIEALMGNLGLVNRLLDFQNHSHHFQLEGFFINELWDFERREPTFNCIHESAWGCDTARPYVSRVAERLIDRISSDIALAILKKCFLKKCFSIEISEQFLGRLDHGQKEEFFQWLRRRYLSSWIIDLVRHRYLTPTFLQNDEALLKRCIVTMLTCCKIFDRGQGYEYLNIGVEGLVYFFQMMVDHFGHQIKFVDVLEDLENFTYYGPLQINFSADVAIIIIADQMQRPNWQAEWQEKLFILPRFRHPNSINILMNKLQEAMEQGRWKCVQMLHRNFGKNLSQERLQILQEVAAKQGKNFPMRTFDQYCRIL